MKKILSLFLVLTLLLSCAAGLAEGQQEEAVKVPAAGEVIQGFEVKEIRDFPMIGAQLVLFGHQKTGAQLLWIANEDTNRAFQLTFPTRPSDDMGLPHVFEHATLFGSEKYPSSSLFFNINYQTYNTYMNAHTTDACTSYPIASLSEEQLLHLADYYVDSCFHPLIMTDESIFRTQAWHYNLPDMDSDLTYEGVVYSEMQGAMTLSRMALEYANDATFPGSALSYSYGGLPEIIPDMTWEDVKAFHDKYYHPSNCLAFLYGKIENPEAFLKLLDETFSQYEKAEFSHTDDGYTPITESVTASYAYPMAEGTDTANQSVVIYYILCPGLKGDVQQEFLVDHTCSMLNQSSSVLMQKMRETFPAATVSCGREVAGPDDAVIFEATGMNENDAEAFKAVVDEALAAVAAEGFAQDMVDSAVNALNISMKLSQEDADPVTGVVYQLAYYAAVTGNPFTYADIIDAYMQISEENRQGALQEMAAKWLTGDVLYTLTTTYPAPGEKEKQDAALKDKLAEIKAGLSEEELQAIIAETNAEPKNEDTSELLSGIKAVTVQSLPEEVRTYTVLDETDENGIRHLESVAGMDGIGRVEILIDAAALPQEDIHWMRLFTRLVGQMNTDTHTKEELDVLSSRYLYNRVVGVNAVNLGDTVHPYLVAEWTVMDDDLPQSYDLIEELLFRTQFTDLQRLTDLITAQKTTVRAQINSNAYSIVLYRALAEKYPFYAYYSYLNFLDYYAFLEQLEAQAAEAPEAVSAKLQEIQAWFRNNAGAVSAYAGNEASIALNRPLADAFLAKMDHTEREAVSYTFETPAKKEALIIDGNIQYNLVTATLADMGLEEMDMGLKAIGSMVADKILVPVLRDQMGVYTPVNDVIEDGAMYLLAYRDPSIRETFDVYASLTDQIAAMETDQDTLDGYIMSCYSELAKPEGELAGAVTAMEDVLAGKDAGRKLTYMKQLKAVTPETVKAAAELYRKAWENGAHGTAGSAAAINEAADLYEVIMNPFNTKDMSNAEYDDVPEDSEHYAGVHFALDSGLMVPKTETAFGAEDPATVGDLIAALYCGLGGAPNAPEEALAWLAGYGLLPADQDLNAEVNEEFLCSLLTAIGAQISTDTPDVIVTRADLADLLSQLFAQ